MKTTKYTTKAKEQSFEEELEDMRAFFRSIVIILRENKKECGTYFIKSKKGNWLFNCDENGDGFIGKPEDYGWATFEFHYENESYVFYGWEPMTYENMGSFIKRVKAVL